MSASSTNADFVLQPKGTGAILAQLPDSATSGGNKRGANAVDLQTYRTASSQVASGNNSVITGGSNNTASGSMSAVSGESNTASGPNSFVGSGQGNNATGAHATVFGNSNTASGNRSNVSGGGNNTASGQYSSVAGGFQATTRSIYGVAAIASGKFGTQGDAQRGQYILRSLTTNATPTVLTADQAAAGTSNQVVLPNNSSYIVRGLVNSHRTDAIGTSSTWSFTGAIRRGANAASTTVVAAITAVLISQDAGAVTWAVAITADTTNGCLKVEFTGEAAKTVRTCALIETVEVTS